MYRFSVPIAIQSLKDSAIEEDLQKYLEDFKKGNITRVFIAILSGAYARAFERDVRSEKLRRAVGFFKANGIETGIWIGGFGHGVVLSHDADGQKRGDYQPFVGVHGEAPEHGYCPLDEAFCSDYMKSLHELAELSPDLIMIDDDFRMNLRDRYYMGCFCPKHLQEFYRLIGEEIPREEIEERIFTGGKNKYRDAYLKMSGETMLAFAKKFRETIDSVNPKIRAGVCLTPTGLDSDGYDLAEMARAFAGNTKPFVRPFGAPYHDKYKLVYALEYGRLQMNWIREADAEIEMFAEGDVYTRPRYNVPSKALEIHDLIHQCDGVCDGMLKYMYDYDHRVGYETGYIERHIENLDLQKRVRSIFEDKTTTGVSVYAHMHKIQNYVLPDVLEPGIMGRMIDTYYTFNAEVLSVNSIPCCYTENAYPVMLCGESARYIDPERLKNGAVMDAAAAKILSERGIDTGLEATETIEGTTGEYYLDAEEAINFRMGGMRIQKLTCKEGAKVLTELLPQKTPGMYRYENQDGMRFLVFAADFCLGERGNINYFNNYCRQKLIVDGLEWAGRKKLPAVNLKNPNFYLLTSKNEHAMSVLAVNMYPDDISETEILLDQTYSKIRTVHGTATLSGDRVRVQNLGAYGFCAFELEI